MLHYQVRFEHDEDGYIVVHFPDFEWGITQGSSEAEAISMAEEVIEIYLQDCIDNGKPLPKTKLRRGKNDRTVRVPTGVALKAELYDQFLQAGLQRNELARRLHVSQSAVDRLFDLTARSTVDQIDAAFRAIEHRQGSPSKKPAKRKAA